jgi:serine kinase of HPr protein (carbohydrate metabolism regulator)
VIPAEQTIHATAVSIGGAGVLLLGPPGAGKSDLALRLIDRGAILIADDRVIPEVRHGRLLLRPPASIAGLLEVRGVGLLCFPHLAEADALLAVDLSAPPARLPDPEHRDILGQRLPLLRVAPFEASAPLKVELAVAHGAPNG